ncbi:cytochrome P450 [Hysterangium stoloniferum]|nr:cytochrome P450 [Hysterangium stoloniferum]
MGSKFTIREYFKRQRCIVLVYTHKASIPVIGGSGLLSSYWSAIDFSAQGKNMVQTGYEKYKGGIFRVAQMDQWNIIISARQHIEELAKASNDVFSFEAAVEETFFVKHLFGPTIATNNYHLDILRVFLTRDLGSIFADLKEEISLAFEDHIPITDEWTAFAVYPPITQIVARASSRIFVGVPLCRNPDYLNLSIRFTLDIAKSRDAISRFPEFLREFAARLLTSAPKTINLTHKHLGPVIEERQKLMNEYGVDYPGKPNDLLSRLMDIAEGEERSPRNFTIRVMTIGVAAIHTSSLTFTHVLFHLAAEPKYLAPLREEVETTVNEHGWSKISMMKMHKLDSFLKESQRMNGLNAISLTRKAMKDTSFSDGTFVPKGALISAAAHPMHLDDRIYANAGAFDGFRFSDIRQEPGREITNQFAATNPDYIGFGHAKHACPGRFFAANELKVMLAHLILNYDIKMEHEGLRPPNLWFGFVCVPDSSCRVMFRRRQA